MSNPLYQPLDPQPAPDPVTPQASPSDPAGYASVTPHGQGPAPYDIQADLGAIQSEIAGAYADAGVAAAGISAYSSQGERQAQSEQLLNSGGFDGSSGGTAGFDVTAGFHGGGGDGWPADVEPDILNTPIQGAADYPANTGTD